MSTGEEVWKRNGRPQSTLAQSFSAALDNIFKLNGLSELEESVTQKKDEVNTQQNQLQDLDSRLREADERLKKLEAKHRRQSQMPMGTGYSKRPIMDSVIDENETVDSSGDSDAQINSSPQSGSRR